MAGKKRSFTIYHRDTDPSQSNAPVSVPQGDTPAFTNDEQDRSTTEKENRRLKALLRQHGIYDPTDPVHSMPFADGLGSGEQASPRGSPAPLSVTPSTEALQDQATVGDRGGTSVDRTDHTVEQDHHLETMLVGPSSISDNQHPQYNESYVEGPVSEKQKRSSSLPPPRTAARPESGRPLPIRRHSFSAIESAKQDKIQHVLALREHSGGPATLQEQQTPTFELAWRQLESTAPSTPTAPNEANSAAQATQQPSMQQDQIDVQRKLYKNKFKQTTRSAELHGKQWLPDMLVTAIRAASKGDGVLKGFLDRERYPKFWFHCFTSNEDRRLDYFIYREGNKVDVGIHKGLPFIYNAFDNFIPIFDDYRARISMHYDSPDKPWSFDSCEGYWKVGVELNRPKEGIASGRGCTRSETDTDSEADAKPGADAKPVADAESEAAAELRNKRADFLYHYIGRRTFSSGKKPSYHYV
ncbi:hypothetical protein LTR70_004193 [Exophiala xenobiotica]|uniref:Uncharacterized protein n=1 Tax=Lithohypha guttulata TaxID=1690604 RepID=A0ABR0KE65_9EURO|nr:hypothetical protein LTR24_003675 [Lithohypha guttulata]KAK5321480.1 hypothetical protein LTR70_004193 [Exophiala xenobiotica]